MFDDELHLAKMNSGIVESTYIAASSDVTAAQLGDEAVLLDLKTGKYFGLNDVGARVWELIGESRTVGGIIDVLVDEYDIARAELRADVIEFLNLIIQNGLAAEAEVQTDGEV